MKIPDRVFRQTAAGSVTEWSTMYIELTLKEVYHG